MHAVQMWRYGTCTNATRRRRDTHTCTHGHVASYSYHHHEWSTENMFVALRHKAATTLISYPTSKPIVRVGGASLFDSSNRNNVNIRRRIGRITITSRSTSVAASPFTSSAVLLNKRATNKNRTSKIRPQRSYIEAIVARYRSTSR